MSFLDLRFWSQIELRHFGQILKLNSIFCSFKFENTNAVSLIQEHKNLFEPSEKFAGSSISWCPPTMNWSAWHNCNIDDGPMATVNRKYICFKKIIIILIEKANFYPLKTR